MIAPKNLMKKRFLYNNMQYVSHSSYLVSIGAIARLIYIYETKFLPQIVLKAISEHKIFWGGMPPSPPERCREQLIKRNPKCCPPTFHDLPTPLCMHNVQINLSNYLVGLFYSDSNSPPPPPPPPPTKSLKVTT